MQSIQCEIFVGIEQGQYNIGHICTRRQCDRGLADHVACRWISAGGQRQEITFGDLERETNRFANVLSTLGFTAGDVLFTLLPKIPEQFICCLGTLKMQMLCGPLFSNIGDKALADRLREAGAKVLVTRRSALNKLARIRCGLPELKTILVTDSDEDIDHGVLSYPRLMRQMPDSFSPLRTAADTPSFIHFTSGSTGKPKGVVHCHGSIVSQHATTVEILQLRPDDIYWCTADQGWVTGTSYGIIGPWSHGVTQVHYGGGFSAERWLRLLADERISVWYTAPTALRMLMNDITSLPESCDLSALRHIYSVGEPLNPEVIHWTRKVLDRDVYDTWFQTETGAIMIANRPGLDVRPGSMGRPATGIKAAIVDDQGCPVNDGTHGMLALKSGWPSMFISYLNNPQAYEEKFVQGYYLSGDIAARDGDGYFWFKGRDDDVINTGGHLISPFEIESVLLEAPEVAESGVIAVPDAMLYEKIVVFVRLKPDVVASRELEVRLRLWISHRVSSIATPHDLVFVNDIPKNNSGKIMRRILKSRYLGLDSGDTTTLENSLNHDGNL